MLVHPEVQKAVQVYHPDLVVRWNPKSTRDTNRYMICQRIRSVREVDERTGLFEEYCWEHPVLWVDQATIINRRWFQALDENRWDHNKKDPLEMVREQAAARRKKVSNMVTDFAQDELWWYWRKHAEQFAMGSRNRKDPTRELKERQDRTGRENLL